jgi:predicted lipid-binding transport protein (Tim44 family)
MAHGVQFPLCPRFWGTRSECNLTTLFGNTATTTASPIDAPRPRKKLGWLPLLTVLFCISYGLMTMLIVEQGATIESQRTLIHDLFRDSAELSATKMKAQIEKHKADALRSQNPSAQSPAAPSTQVPSTQAQSNPSSQAAPQRGMQVPQHFQMPSKPASDQATDTRALIKI